MRPIAILIALALVACSAPAAAPVGNPAVYERIGAMTDCRELQKEFDTAEANGKRHRGAGQVEQAKWTTAYMTAADDRMKEVGCYK